MKAEKRRPTSRADSNYPVLNEQTMRFRNWTLAGWGAALAGWTVSPAAAHSSTSAVSEGGFQPLILVAAVILLVLFFVFVDRHDKDRHDKD